MATHNVRRYTKKTSKQKSEIDKLVYFAIVIGPLLTVPQVYSIWVQGQTGVSLISWFAYLLASMIWLFYGIKHHDRPIIITEVVWITLEVLIVLGLLRH